MAHSNPRAAPPVAEPAASVAVGGLLVVAFGTLAVLTAAGMGWLGAVTLGVVLLAAAWKVPVSRSAAVLRTLVAGFGVLALLGAIYDLLV